MASGTTNMEGSGVERAPLSADIQAAVRAELDGILKAPIFTQSNRCKRFLSHVVMQTLAGNAGELKERTIGINVFERTNDYDTGDDSIVRVTANEVRKRLGQYYGESAGAHVVQIELPRGSYVPEFRIQAVRHSTRAAEVPASKPTPKAPEQVEVPSGVEIPILPAPAAEVAGPTRISKRRLLYWSAAATFVLVVAVAAGILGSRPPRNIPEIWSSFHAGTPVLLCIDTHELQAPSPASPESKKFVDMVLRKQIIALDDAAVLASMGALLGKKEIPFRVVGAEQTSLADLRRQPVVLIGVIDNRWTIRLTENLPYRIEVANPPHSGTEKEPVASIVDSRNPAARWSTDLSIPFNAWKSDYAVIARFDDATTGVPVLIEAGLGNDGTLAASELISSGGLTADLAREPSCHGKKNFEAVIETQIIDTKSGPPHVLRLACW